MNKADVLIIGSGISSLTCAALLSKKGKSVIVLEQYNKPGGYLHCFSRFGQRFDTGAHYVGALDPGQPFHTLLNYLNVYDSDLFIPLDPTGFDEFHFPDFQSHFPKGYEPLIQHLSQQFPQEHQAIKSYFGMIQDVVKHFPTYEFNDYSNDAIVKEASETPLATVVNQLTSNQQLQCLFYSYCSLHGVTPEEVSFGFHAIVTDSLIRGPYGLKHGGDALAKKFVQTIEANGGQVLTKRRVLAIKVENKQVTEVETQEGSRFSAEWIISGIHPKATFGLINTPEILTPAFKDRIKNIKESIGIFGIYASCANKIPLNPLRNYYFFGSSDPRALFLESHLPSRPSAVFVSSANRQAKIDEGCQSLNLHAPCPIEWVSKWKESKYGARAQEYKDLKSTYAEDIFSTVNQYYPDFRSSLSQFVTSTPLTNLHFNGSVDGSAYGIYHSIQNTGARALGPRTKVNNLLLTGQSCLFPGLMGAAISGLRTSGHIVGIKPILNELKNMKKNYD